MKKPKSLFFPLFSSALFVFLSCLNLKTAIWFDEAYSAFLIRGSFREIWTATAVDVHPPFYYFCLKIWSLIFGTSDFALRSMSVFFGVVALLLAFFLIRRLFGEKPANFSALLLAISPFFIRYAEEMRMYTLVFVIVLAATLVLNSALKSTLNSKKPPLKLWLSYGALISLGMWTHYFSALAWLAHLIYIIYALQKSGLLKSSLKTLALAYALAVTLYLPWLPSFFSQVKSVQAGFWILAVNVATPFDFFSEALLVKTASETENWLALLVFSVVFLAAFLLQKAYKTSKLEQKSSFNFLFSLIFLPPFLLILLSLPPFSPTFLPRYVFYSASLIWVLLALAVYFGKGTKLTPFLVALIFLTSGVGVYSVLTRENSQKEREIITLVQVSASENQPILLDVEPMAYYNLFFYETENNPIYAADAEIVWGSLEPMRNYNKNLENPSAFLENQTSFWLIFPNDPDRSLPDSLTIESFELKSEIKTEDYLAQEYSIAFSE